MLCICVCVGHSIYKKKNIAFIRGQYYIESSDILLNYRGVRFHRLALIVSLRASRYHEHRGNDPGERRNTRGTVIFEICLVDVISSVIRSDVMLTSRYKKDFVFI